MKKWIGIAMMAVVGFASAQSSNVTAKNTLYPFVVGSEVFHMKSKDFYAEINKGGYLFQGCHIIFKDSANKKVIYPLDSMTNYSYQGDEIKVINHTHSMNFKPLNNDEFVNALMSHRYYPE